jgi:hypothetical protein
MATKVKTTRTHGTALLACKNHPHLRWRQTKYVLEGKVSAYMGRGVLMFDGDTETGKKAAPFSSLMESSLARREPDFQTWFRENFAVECDCSVSDLEFLGWVD